MRNLFIILWNAIHYKAASRNTSNDRMADMAAVSAGASCRIFPGILPMTGWPTWLQYLPAPLAGFLMTFDQILFLTGIVDPKDLLYSEEEIDYAKIVKENEADMKAEGGKA